MIRYPFGGIRARITALVVTGLVAMGAVLVWIGWSAVQMAGAHVLPDRAALADSVARHVDDLLQADSEVLQQAALAPPIAAGDTDSAGARMALKEAYLRLRLMEAVHLVDSRGAWRWSEPPAAAAALDDPAVGAELRAAISAMRPAVTGLVSTVARGPRVFTVMPCGVLPGTLTGAVVGEIDPLGPRFAQARAALRFRADVRSELVDRRAVILASMVPERVLTRSAEQDVVTEALADRRPIVSGPWRLGGTREYPIVAAAPLARAPWVVIIRHAARDDSGAALARQLLLIAPLVLGAALLYAWGTAQSVTRPLAVLTHATERIAAGTLDEALPIRDPRSEDEVGRLARSFEAMRAALKASLDRIERANQELETRVAERTRELDVVTRQLRERDQARTRLLNKLITAQEDERKRIARELHDETSQLLSALVLRLESGSADRADVLRDAKGLALRTLDEIHRIIYDLRPAILDDLGLVAAIRWSATQQLASRQVAVRCEFNGLEGRLAPEIETAVFRIVQEAITNIARHARAENVLIQATAHEGTLTIEIEDDGIGFDVGRTGTAGSEGGAAPGETGRGLGLLGMRERVELLGGVLRVDSAPGEGTAVTVRLPLNSLGSQVSGPASPAANSESEPPGSGPNQVPS